jgi:hypothetical protein
MTRGAHKTRMVYLTLVSSGVWRRFGTELSKPSVDRRITVGARRASFGASSWGWKEVERGRVSVETRTQKKQMQPNAVMVEGETHAHRRGAGPSFARAQTCDSK